MKKERVDTLLVERGLAETREKAKRSVMAGLVFSGSERIDKPGMKINRDSSLEIKGQVLRYVGRGGLKMEKALQEFQLRVDGQIFLDIGASTGGFSDCCLQNGATLAYALDVGYNQLAWQLRQDQRVVVMERTNFRYVTPDDFSQGVPSFAAMDVSFISVKKLLPVLKTVLQPGSDAVILIKPQFEAGREEVGKKGVVKDAKIHETVVCDMITFSMQEGFTVRHLSFSPITGGNGNIEFLLHIFLPAENEKQINSLSEASIKEIVSESHRVLKQTHQ